MKLAFLCHVVPWHLQRENLFCPSHCKTRWTMTMDIVGMQIGPFEDLKFDGHPYNFILDVN